MTEQFTLPISSSLAKRNSIMEHTTVTFIGCGNMAGSLIKGLVADDYPESKIRVSDPSPAQFEKLAEYPGIQRFDSNTEAILDARIVVLAVKPQKLRDVCQEIGPMARQQNPLILSIAAGVRSQAMENWLGGALPIIRAMPNTPSMFRTGTTGLFANRHADGDHRNQAESILRAVGLTLWMEEESLIDAVTAVSGSGPAYFFLMMELLERKAHDLGLDSDTARLMAIQTALGSARMALESSLSPEELRNGVTSPKGTTEAAIKVLLDGGFDKLFAEAIQAAHDRAGTLSVELEQADG
jgi:pyrroline-5-carboxylate reductase